MAPLWRLAGDVLGDPVPRRAVARLVAGLIREPHGIAASSPPVLRHTVVTLSYSSSLVAAIRAAGVRAICARSEPGGEGEAMAAALREAGVDAEVADDDHALAAAADGALAAVGADAVGPEGFVNKVGTARLGRAAGRAGAYVVAGSTKFLAEDLPVTEPFERIPIDAFGTFLTEAGPLGSADAAWLARRFPLEASLAPVFDELR
jgi:hypothetical protein